MPASVISSRDVIQLAEEMEALIRAGVPLGGGLQRASAGWRGRLGNAARELADQLEQGVPPARAIETADLPDLFRATVAASLGGGREAQILAAFAASGRRMLELRETVVRALIYPAVVLVFAVVLGLAMLIMMLPEYGRTLTAFQITPPAWYGVATRARALIVNRDSWPLPAGCAAAALVVSALIVARREAAFDFLARRLGGHRALSDLQRSAASNALSLLIDSQVELPLALRLTGGLLRDRSETRALARTAHMLEHGEPLRKDPATVQALPALWRPLLTADFSGEDLAEGLRQSAELYAARAQRRAEMIARVLPALLACILGGGATVLYALALFVPLAQLWQGLGAAQ